MKKNQLINFIKTCIVLILFLTSCSKDKTSETKIISVDVNDVSIELAKKVAVNFAKSDAFKENQETIQLNSLKTQTINGFEEKSIDSVYVIPDDNGNTAMYVVTFDPSGYVIVSATKKESPILGFSEIEKFNLVKLPPGLAGWMMSRADKIKVLKYSTGIEIPLKIQTEWAARSSFGNEFRDNIPPIITSTSPYQIQIGPLLATNWDQGEGYNNSVNKNIPKKMYCSDYSNGNPPAGCVAIAMAQIMKYHKYPAKYKWDQMPINNGTNVTSDLITDIGKSVNMQYSCSGSGAYVGNASVSAQTAFRNSFGYTSRISYVDYNIDIALNELKKSRPFIMEGYNIRILKGWGIFKNYIYNEGHAWNCDGYKETLNYITNNAGLANVYTTQVGSSGPYLHMNWGWGGDYNGWFLYNNFTINSNGKQLNFQYYQKMLIGIKP